MQMRPGSGREVENFARSPKRRSGRTIVVNGRSLVPSNAPRVGASSARAAAIISNNAGRKKPRHMQAAAKQHLAHILPPHCSQR
jgi:hypothetical protein